MKCDEYFKLLGKVGPYLKLLLKELRSYESRVKELAKYVNKLQKEEKIVQYKVREEKRHGRAIDNDVIKWLKDVEGVICLYDNFLKDEDHKYALFSDGYLPKPAIRYRLSVMVIHIAKKVTILLQTAKHDNFSYWLAPSFEADFDNIRYESFASRNPTVDGIKAALANSNDGVIGVYGCSGVGKTSLIKEVAKKVKGSMFDVVIMVNVTSLPDIRSIQGQIADKLGMKLEEESESGRAARIWERLKNPKEKTLIILDNLGVKLDFNMLGIPSENNDGSQMNHKLKNPSAHHNYAMKTEEFVSSSLMKIEEPLAKYRGCKVLMISGSEQLLLSQMDGKGIQTFCVKPLTEDEAVMMFKAMAERGDENSMFETLAAKIAKMCKGLPMIIVTTANALKSKSLPVWEDAYRKLERQNLTGMPEFSTKLSYDLLEDEELKHTFLLCARMNHDALITDLVRYCIGLGLLGGIYTVREARDRVHVLVGKLKELNLLSDSFSSDRFTMQDIVRDAALSIASQQMHAFVLTKGKLDEWPDEDEFKRYTAISLQHCDVTDIIEDFPKGINCSRLRVFHLDNKDPSLTIPNEIFEGMKELRVLILTGVHLSPVPSSIKCLTKLRMLCLERCKLGENISIIGELKRLRVLSLSGCDIVCLPVELSRLTKLQIFDTSNCFKLKEIPADVLSSLNSLEELYVGNSPIQWIDGQGNASLSELRNLDQLTTLDIHIPKITDLPKNLFFDKLDSYKIVISEYFNTYPVSDFKMLDMYEASRYLALQLEDGFDIHDQKEIKILFRRVENLLLGQLNDVEDIFFELNYDGFPYLKYFSVVGNSKVKSIINSNNKKHPEKAFSRLESLFLYEVNNMEHMCQGQLTHDSFCKLKIIKLKICGHLKNVFFSSMIKHLSALETIEVSECNSLKEIVTLETQSNGDQIKFPELRSLVLQSLSEFIGFYTLGASIGEQVLFGEKVEISKLEKLELSSIKIQKIWSDQSYFHNLIYLDVNDCWNMTYLLSLSISKSLMNLQSLFVSKCGRMDSIFKEEEFKESIFPKLKNINLNSMKRLTKIWAKFPLRSFGKLDALIIEGCNKLKNVFPSDMVGRFQSLCTLKITNCMSMREIFDLKDCKKPDAEDMTSPNLQNVHLEALPKLEHVWNKDPEGILNFENLKKIWVQECLILEHIFPVSIAMGLEKLEYLEILNCGQLKQIVSERETNNVDSISFKFPKLTTARFWKLPNLECLYSGTHKLHCSALNNFSVELCHKLKLFTPEIVDDEIFHEPEETNPVFLPEEVIYNLKSMQIELRDANWLMRYLENYPMRKLEEVQLSRLVGTKILYFFLHRNPNLKSLLLSNCFIEKLVPPSRHEEEKSRVVPKLKSLKLMNLPSLNMIGFEEDTLLFQRLECLVLKECPSLDTLAPSSVSFTYLKNLEVSNCNKLSYLMTPSTAKSLVQLTTMKVIQCESMKAIVSEQENEELIVFGKSEKANLQTSSGKWKKAEPQISSKKKKKKAEEATSSKKLKEKESDIVEPSEETEQRIIFRQLKEMELVALHTIESFYSSIHYAFDFPSLEKFIVSECDNMERFTYSEQDKAPILRQICARDGMEENRYYWKGDLNSTIKHMYQIRALHPNKMVASDPLKPLESFRLKTLKLVKCELQPVAIPPAVFPSLKNLEELEIRSTNVKEIFDIQETKMKGYPFPLKKLTLDDLSNLTRVWKNDCEGILGFQNLQEVLVANCENLTTLFPSKLAKKVEKLEKLEIRQCEMFDKIVEEENAITEEFSFPRLTSLDLRMLPELTSFCPGKAVFILESLKLDWKTTMMLCNGNFPEDMLHELVELELDFGDDVNEVSNFPLQKFEKASNLEYFHISQWRGLEELFLYEPEQGEIQTHGHLKTWSLFCKELQKLCICSCPHLTTLVHPEGSFSNLKQLSIKDCHGLKYLFTSSTARKLVHLEEMYVVNCGSMKEIVAKELEETTPGAIEFERLNTIILDSLSSLSRFYSGNRILRLSSLIRVLILQCPKMVIFSRGLIDAESLLEIQISSDPNESVFFHEDLNTAVKEMFQQKDLQEFFEALGAQEDFSGNNLELQAALQDGNVGLQNKWLGNLVTLQLYKSTLPYAIPLVILRHLVNLKELLVKQSDNVKVIFDMNDSELIETTSQLKKMTLHSLDNLTRVWEKNSEGVAIFQHLQEVVVCTCENLQTLFPASLAKNLKELQKLEIESCDKLEEIVENEEGTPTNLIEKFEFPHLESLSLRDLPQVTCFYPQTFILDFPSLNSLCVWDCDMLELFQSGHPTGEGENGGTSRNKQPIISSLKVLSNLKELKLDRNQILAFSLWLESKKFEDGLNYLEKISLSFYSYRKEKDTLPVNIFCKVPNLMEMRILGCKCTELFLAEHPKIGEDGMLGELRILRSDLQSIESERSSWPKTICEKLQILNVENCYHLTTLKHSTSTVSFSCLREVYIFNCHQLQYLFTSSAARKLMNLEVIKVIGCESVKAIVAKEGDGTSEAIKFERLNTIVLLALPSLVCFYSGSDTLQLSSLIKLHLRDCRNMRYFSQGIIHAESFRGIGVSSQYTEEDLLVSQDLNASLKGIFQRKCIQQFLDAVDEECFFDKPDLEAVRHRDVDGQNRALRNLVTVKLSKHSLPYAIPSAILPHLKSLKELQVRDNDKVEVIFDMNDIDILETPSQLKILILKGLSKLIHVWEKNSQGVAIFQNLQEVVVCDCGNLQTLFPASLAKNLTKLEKLQIESCEKLQETVEKEEGIATNVSEKFVFPRLEKLHLRNLPQLPQTFSMECPVLNDLSVLYCDDLELFQSEYPNGEGEGTGTSISRQPIISILEVIYNLKELTLGWKHISALSKRFRSGQFMEVLKNLNKISLFFDHDENDKPVLPIEILQSTPNLIEMTILRCKCTELFLAEHPKIGEDRMPGELRMLRSDLQSIESEHSSSWPTTICEKLQILNVENCPHLTTLKHSTSTVSFSCLKKVSISNCHQLQYLFTSSAARKLMNLEEITVKECESVKEIVAKEGDGTSEAIKLERLNTIVLLALPSLVCFYSGSDTLQLSSLIRVHIQECRNMRYFSQGVIYAESFRGIDVSSPYTEEDLLVSQDLNATIKGMFQQQEFFEALDVESFTEESELNAVRHGVVVEQNRWLHNLEFLKLSKCTLSCAIPYVILTHLKSLEELQVRDNDKVEVIFGLNDTEILKTTSQLKILSLKGLLKLRHVWENNSEGVLIFQNLEKVVIKDCGNLQTLFPAPLANNLKELQRLKIVSCHKLQEIVENEEGTPANVTEKFLFPHLESLYLEDLPQVTYFYPQTFTPECPALEALFVMKCDELELFQSAHSTSEGEGGGTSINRKPLISNLKVISNVEVLQLDWKHISALSLWFESEKFMEGLKVLKEFSLCFDANENEKPMLPIEILQKAPNLKRLGIGYCKSLKIFLAENPNIGENGMLGQLKALALYKVSALQSIVLKDSSWLNTICEKLHKLYVVECPNLTTLVHSTSTVSFTCLKKVSISECADLQYLFTSSAAKKLMNLEEITLKECGSVKKIVAEEGDEDEHKGECEDKYENEIVFGKLEILTLDSLPKFERFYIGSSTLNFPSLTKVEFTQCNSTKIFRLGDNVPTELEVTIDGVVDWEDGINFCDHTKGSSLS